MKVERGLSFLSSENLFQTGMEQYKAAGLICKILGVECEIRISARLILCDYLFSDDQKFLECHFHWGFNATTWEVSM